MKPVDINVDELTIMYCRSASLVTFPLGSSRDLKEGREEASDRSILIEGNIKLPYCAPLYLVPHFMQTLFRV